MLKPYFEDKSVTIYHGDARELVPLLQADMVLTDPPYGIGVAYDAFEDTPENVLSLVQDVVPKCLNRFKRTVLTCPVRQIRLYPQYTWILCWLNKAGANVNSWGFTCWQLVLVYGPDPYLEHRLGSHADVIEHSEAAPKNGHPCPKPINFWKKLLARTSVLKTDTVLDPFMGSGTTLRAAKELNRKAIGIDVSERYCEIAANYCRQEVLEF